MASASDKELHDFKTLETIQANALSVKKQRKDKPIVTVLDNNSYIYLDSTTRKVDLSDWKSYKCFLNMIFTPILLAFLIIIVPLGGVNPLPSETPDSTEVHAKINAWAYVIFQVVYNIIAFPCLVLPVAIPFHSILPGFYTWGILPFIIMTGGVFIFYYMKCIAYRGATAPIVGLTYLFGVLYNFVTIWVSFFFAALYMQLNGAKRMAVVSPAPKGEIELQKLENGQTKANNDKQEQTFQATSTNSVSIAAPTGDAPTKRKNSLFDSNLNSVVLSDYLSLYPRVLFLSMLHAGMFSWDSWFTTWFTIMQAQGEASSDKNKKQVSFMLAFIFLFVTSSATLLVRIMGNLCDRALSKDSPSLNIIGGIMGDTFLIVFLRNLFSVVDSWDKFLGFTFATALFEVSTYQFTMTETYEKVHDYFLNIAIDDRDAAEAAAKNKNEIVVETRSLGSKLFHWGCWVYAVTHNWQDGNIFVHKNCLNLAYRYVIRVSSTISFILYEIFLRYGYNKYYYAARVPSEADFGRLMAFIIIAFTIETLVMIPANWMIHKRTGMSLLYRLVSFFNHPEAQEYIVFFVWVLAHIQSDVFIAKIDYLNAHL